LDTFICRCRAGTRLPIIVVNAVWLHLRWWLLLSTE
jgi:hypothetical protein